ncbi:MAG: hypothetical protein QM702_20690 [Rubrivivax sp.]
MLVAAMGGYRKPVLELVEAFRKETGTGGQAAFGHIKQIETQARQNPDVAFLIGDRNLLEPTGLFSRFDPASAWDGWCWWPRKGKIAGRRR